MTISNVTFTGRSLGAKGIDSGIALYNFDSHIPLSIHFANGARAFGADFSSQYNAVPSFTATLSLDNGETFQFTAPTDPNSTFFGFVSPTPIMDITFSDGGLFPSPGIGHQELIGNLYMVMQVPEPAAIAWAGLGAALLLGWRLHKKRKRETQNPIPGWRRPRRTQVLKTRADQTLRDYRAFANNTERLECGVFTAAFCSR